jgi:glucose/arabinose dehydrogenase
MRTSLGLVFLLVAGCSSSGIEPPAADPATAEKAPEAAPRASRGLIPPPPTEAMVQQIQAQKVLEHPRVAPYLHTEIAANVPLSVFPSPDLARGADKLTAAGQPVRVVATEGEARVVFRGLEDIGPAKVRVKFEVPPEGVAGHVDLLLADDVWSAVDANVVER